MIKMVLEQVIEMAYFSPEESHVLSVCFAYWLLTYYLLLLLATTITTPIITTTSYSYYYINNSTMLV
jgi:hypothetical protein